MTHYEADLDGNCEGCRLLIGFTHTHTPADCLQALLEDRAGMQARMDSAERQLALVSKVILEVRRVAGQAARDSMDLMPDALLGIEAQATAAVCSLAELPAPRPHSSPVVAKIRSKRSEDRKKFTEPIPSEAMLDDLLVEIDQLTVEVEWQTIERNRLSAVLEEHSKKYCDVVIGVEPSRTGELTFRTLKNREPSP